MSTAAKVSFYNSAKDIAPSKEVTIRELVRIIHDEVHADGVARVRSATTEDGKRIAKMKLPAVQMSGCVTDGNRAQAIQQGRFVHSGWLQLDVDGPGLGMKTPEQARAILGADKHVLSAFITPSGEGAKALFKITPCLTDDDHKQAFRQVEKYIFDTYGLQIDPSTKDPGRLCFIPSDKDCTWNELQVEFVPSAVAPHAISHTPLVIRGHAEISNEWTLADLADLIAGIPRPEYDEWLAICSGGWNQFGEAATPVFAAQWAEEQPGEYDRKFKNRTADHTIGTVVYYAKSYGWTPKPRSIRTGSFSVREAPAPEKAPDLMSFDLSDADNALRVHAVAGGNFHYVAESGQWLVWDGCRWSPDRDGKMVRLFLNVMDATARQGLSAGKGGESAVKFAIRCRDRAKVTAGLEMLKSVQGVTISASDLDADPWMLGTPNGLIDLRVGLPVPPDKKALVTKSISCDFDPEATCPTWESVIHTAAAGDQELIRFLQAWTGYTLTGSVEEECLAFLHGTGANSKGTVTECIRKIMGDYAITAPESLFVIDRNSSATNDIARLSGCRMACAAELDENASFAESRLKAITGRDVITARFLHREFFDFQPTHKFWISGNHKPSVHGVDHGIWRRIRLIPFAVTIPKEQRDLKLADKLSDEMPGILNWAIAGCMIWQREGLQSPQCVAKATADYQKAEDVVGQFLDDTTDSGSDERTLQSSLFESYKAWCETQGIRKTLSATMLNRKLEERGMTREKSNGVKFWQGITLKSGKTEEKGQKQTLLQ